DFIFNGIFTYHPVGKDIFSLPDTMRTVNSLLLHSRVPPWIYDIHIICRSKVKTHTTGFKGYQEYSAIFIFLESFNGHFPLCRTGRSVEIFVINTQFFKPSSDKRKHSKKL